EIGLAITVFNTVSASLQTPAGFLADRIGAHRVLVAGLTLSATAFALVGLVPSYWLIVALYALAGLGNTVYHPADYAILSQHVSPDRVSQAFSIHTFLGLLGTALAPVSVLMLQAAVGWRGAFMVTGLAGAVIAAVLIAQRDALADPDHARTRTRVAAPAARDIRAGSRLLFSPPILGNLVLFCVLALTGGGLQTYSVVALGALYGTPLSVANTALSGYLLMGAFGVLLGGLIAARVRRHDLVAALGLVVTGS